LLDHLQPPQCPFDFVWDLGGVIGVGGGGGCGGGWGGGGVGCVGVFLVGGVGGFGGAGGLGKWGWGGGWGFGGGGGVWWGFFGGGVGGVLFWFGHGPFILCLLPTWMYSAPFVPISLPAAPLCLCPSGPSPSKKPNHFTYLYFRLFFPFLPWFVLVPVIRPSCLT